MSGDNDTRMEILGAEVATTNFAWGLLFIHQLSVPKRRALTPRGLLRHLKSQNANLRNILSQRHAKKATPFAAHPRRAIFCQKPARNLNRPSPLLRAVPCNRALAQPCG